MIFITPVPGHIVEKLKRLRGIRFKTEKDMINALHKKLGRRHANICEPILLNHPDLKGATPYYNHPTRTDKRLLSLVNANRMGARIGEPARYKIIKHRVGAREKDAFMFVATPADNKEGYDPRSVYKDNVKGYLKISGPNKVEKEKTYDSSLPAVPAPNEMNALVHNCYPSLRTVSVRCGRNRDKERVRYRLVPEFACSEAKDGGGEKGFTYSMTKRCERVFLGKKLPGRREIVLSRIAGRDLAI